MANKSKKSNYFESAQTRTSQQTKANNNVKAKTQAKYNAMPKMSVADIEKSMLEVGNVEENFPKVEKLLFEITGIKPAENTIDSRLRCMYTSANAKLLSKVTPHNMRRFREIIKANFNILICYPMDLMAKHVKELTQEEFDKVYSIETPVPVEDVIKSETINSVRAFKAYGEFNREGKKWPDYYDAEYTMCGMADELVEFANATDEEKPHELGDILWYFMSICEFWEASDEELQEIVDKANAFVNDINHDKPDCTKAFHKFVKLLRDDPANVGNFTVIKDQMADVFCTLILYACGIDELSEVALENIAKIRSRIARGVVRGSGDNR